MHTIELSAIRTAFPRDYEFIEVNAAFEAFTGLKGPDIIGRRVTEIFPGIGEAEYDWVKIYGEVALHGGRISFKQFSDQLNKWYGVTACSPEKYYFITYFVDVSEEKEYVTKIENLQKTAEETEILYKTDLRQEEEALLTNRRQMSDIMDFLPDATLAIDREGHVIIWNKAIEKMTGIPALEMIGKGGYAYSIPFYGEARSQLMDLVYKDDEEIAARYSSIVREGNTLISEAFCPALYHGKGAWVYAKASPLHDQAGNIVGTIESIRDISRQKLIEADIAREKNLLETTLRSI